MTSKESISASINHLPPQKSTLSRRAFLSNVAVAGVTGSLGVGGLLTACSTGNTGNKEEKNARQKFAPELSLLPAGDIMPAGWMKIQMELDLKDGLPGNYPKVSNIVSIDLFANRNATLRGAYHYPGDSVERSWWVGEVEGNWYDAVTRLGYLTRNREYMERTKNYFKRIIEAQKKEPDGYIGIYVPEDRFVLDTPETRDANNGELWTQSRFFQGMLAYYEYTKDSEALDAVIRAVDCTLKNLVGKKYFYQAGGVAHGVAFTDTLEWLYRLTGDRKYAEGMRWLYEDFTAKRWDEKSNGDMGYVQLSDAGMPWYSHTPHTMEAIHAPIVTYKMTGDEKYKLAAENVMLKYDRHDTPGGGVVGDEHVDRRLGTTMLPREYCTMVSAVMGLNRVLVWGGDLSVSERVERLVFNAAQGSRLHPAMTAIRYLGHDNQKTADNDSHLQRYLYSSWHSAAPCCATTAGRMLPYYVEGMWLADHPENTIIANYYGPNELNTVIAGKKVSITQHTDYPFSDKVELVFNIDSDVTLVLRKPKYSENVSVKSDSADIDSLDDRIIVRKSWKKGDRVSIDFHFKPRLISEMNLMYSAYYRWGPLLFSLPLGEIRKTSREYIALDNNPSGFFLWEITPKDTSRWQYKYDMDEPFEQIELEDGNRETPFANPPIGLKGKMIAADGQSKTEVILTPLGSSVLRRTGFPLFNFPAPAVNEESF